MYHSKPVCKKYRRNIEVQRKCAINRFILLAAIIRNSIETMSGDQGNTNGRSGSALPALKMKRQNLPGTISPRPNRSTCSTVISASSVGQIAHLLSSHPLKLVLRTKWPITTKSRFPLKNSADHGSCPEEFGSPLFADENTNSKMFRTIST